MSEYANPVCRGSWALSTACGLCERCIATKPGPNNVTRIRHAMPVSTEMNKAIADLDTAVAKAIDAAKVVGLPQGFVVSILHGHAHAQTDILVS
ncbi:MAG: hypothetical protein JWP42_4018 [Pseudomonas sp.]|nr:hypothetical protein [Pseudomonas sp.]